MAKTITVDLSAPLVDFNGEPVTHDITKKPISLAWALNKFILQNESKGENLVKAVLWAGDLRESNSLQLDDDEFRTLSTIVKDAQVGAVVKGPIFIALQDAKDASTKAE